VSLTWHQTKEKFFVFQIERTKFQKRVTEKENRNTMNQVYIAYSCCHGFRCITKDVHISVLQYLFILLVYFIVMLMQLTFSRSISLLLSFQINFLQAVVSAGHPGQQEYLDKFMALLSATQLQVLGELETLIKTNLYSVMATSDNLPSPRLIDVITTVLSQSPNRDAFDSIPPAMDVAVDFVTTLASPDVDKPHEGGVNMMTQALLETAEMGVDEELEDEEEHAVLGDDGLRAQTVWRLD
jgi:hypothetical protein